jgi:Zn-dependent protease
MDILSITVSLFVILFAITIHEASHGWAAMKMGDPTAQALGRVTLNPIAHIDLFGTILVPILLVVMGAPAFGWAKPVPVNPYNLKNPRRDNLWISFAGPAANLVTSAVSLVFILLLKSFVPSLLSLQGLVLILYYMVLLNAFLAVFNLIPVPPLDGSGILSGLLSKSAAEQYDRLRPYGFFIVLILIYAGALNMIIGPIKNFVDRIIFN